MAAELAQMKRYFPDAENLPDGDFQQSCAGCSVVEEGAVLPEPEWSPHLSVSCGKTPTYSVPHDPGQRAPMQPSKPDVDLYWSLDIDREATAAQLRKAYLRKAAQWHPDKHVTASKEDQDAASEKFKTVANAFEVLSDEKRRLLYDKAGTVYHHGSPVLVCTHCQKSNGNLVRVRIELAKCADNLITNSEGEFFCYDRLPRNAERSSLPRGSFTDSCFGCTASDDVLSCTACLDDNGDRHTEMHATLFGCASFGFELVSDDEGALVCEEEVDVLPMDM